MIYMIKERSSTVLLSRDDKGCILLGNPKLDFKLRIAEFSVQKKESQNNR